ncbi:hypothetical protein [Natronorarus salvus]
MNFYDDPYHGRRKRIADTIVVNPDDVPESGTSRWSPERLHPD